ncbi:uncharacterized protein LOC121557014 [Coregonus clupeaformis]|uniref:uncharacterized protein LOC121557014 n=1 Tax=Coregonus clupeaformis TaxID=59861 RepID=UPI001E1C9009|nr:uncharacterized protein LOC121557014 [Coregonus clupeaformis]
MWHLPLRLVQRSWASPPLPGTVPGPPFHIDGPCVSVLRWDFAAGWQIPLTKKFDNDKDYENYTTTFAVFLPAKVKKAELTLKKKKNIAWSTLDLLSSLFVNREYPWKGFYRYQAPLPAATPARPPTFSGRDFITKHRIALETRLGILQPILSHLEDQKVLNAEEKEEVVSKSTKTLQNQALLDMVVRKGARAQEHFYQVLKKVNPYLVEDLEEQTV